MLTGVGGRRARRRAVVAGIASGLALLLVLFAGVASAALPPGDPAPSIGSDKADYAPGQLVTLTGSNWSPGESVHIYVNDDQSSSWSRDTDVTADESGLIQDQFNLPDWFVASYSVKATGSSGSVATTSFTDGNVFFAHFKPAIQTTALSTASASGTYGGTVNLSATLTSGGNGVSGKSITFKLNGGTVGTATTNSSGVASLTSASLNGIAAGTYSSG